MKSSNYITKVISHITGKRQKQLVEYELNDHIIEKHNFYKDIGYDDDASLDKADEIMGDADIVGEQFEALNRARNIRKIIASAVSFLLFVTACAYISISSDSSGIFYDYIFSFYGYIACNIIFILNLISIIYGFRKLRANNILFGCIACLGVLGTGGKYIENAIYYLLTGKNVFLSFYGIYDSYNELHSPFQYVPFEYSESSVVYAILIIFIIAVLTIGATLIVRLGKLKNTRKDLKVNLTVRIILIVLTIGLTALFFYYLYEVPSYRDEVIAQTRADLEEYDKIFIDNLDTFISGDYYEIAEVLRDEFGADVITQQEIDNLGNNYSIKYQSNWDYNNTSHYVYYFVFIDPESGFDFETRAIANDLDGKPLRYCTDDETAAIEPLISDSNTKPQDLPYPFEINYTRGTAMDSFLTAVYNKYDYEYDDDYADSNYAGYENFINFTGDIDDMYFTSGDMNQNEKTLSFKANAQGAEAIIGGADGPTAVFVTSRIPWWAIVIGAAVIAVIITVIIKRKKK